MKAKKERDRPSSKARLRVRVLRLAEKAIFPRVVLARDRRVVRVPKVARRRVSPFNSSCCGWMAIPASHYDKGLPRRSAARGLPSGRRQLCGVLCNHRWRASVCFLWLARFVLLRHGRQLEMGKGFWQTI